MGTKTGTDVKNRVVRVFGDESGAQLTDSDILMWINDGQREAVLQNEGLLEDVVTINTVTDDFDYAKPANMFAIHIVKYRQTTSDPYQRVEWLSLRDFETFVSDWEGNSYSGVPVVWTEREDQILLFPTPDTTTTAGLQLVISRMPTDLAALTNTIDLPDYYFQYLIDYVLMQAYEMDEDAEAHARKAGVVQATLDFNEARENWMGRDKYPVIQPMPEDYI